MDAAESCSEKGDGHGRGAQRRGSQRQDPHRVRAAEQSATESSEFHSHDRSTG
jgi:hypothetical protein